MINGSVFLLVVAIIVIPGIAKLLDDAERYDDVTRDTED